MEYNYTTALEIAKKWLDITWYSAAFLVKDFKKANWTVDTSINYSLENLIQINRWSNDEGNTPYWIHYTPNWKLWTKNVPWNKIHRKNEDVEPYIARLYVDIDWRMGNIKSKQELLDSTLNTIKSTWLKVSHILETKDGYHLYIPILPSDKAKLGRALGNEWFEIVEWWIANLFEWGDKNIHKMNWLMRLPLSLWNKLWPSFQTKLYKLNRVRDENWQVQSINLIEITSADELEVKDEDCVIAQSVIDFYNNIKPVDMNATDSKEAKQQTTVNQLPFPEVFKKLEDYPREYNGSTYIYRLDWNEIKISENWWLSFRSTDGYRLNRQDNYVNNFSFASHNIDERPRWSVFPFLYRYFNQNIPQLKQFLLKEFNIDLDCNSWTIYNTFTTGSSNFQFTDSWIYLNSTVEKKGNVETYRRLIMKAKIEVRWILKTHSEMAWETKNVKIKYIFHNKSTDEDILISYKETTKKFNAEYWEQWLRFKDTDKSLIEMFDAMDEAGEEWILPIHTDITQNWYYSEPKMFVYWAKVFGENWEEMDTSSMNVIFNTEEIPEHKIEKEISVAQYCNKLRDVFSDREAMLASCWWLTGLSSSSFWIEVLWNRLPQVLVPWTFFTGATRAWKSTMINILKEWAWMNIDARKVSIAKTTPQPLQQDAQDCLPLHLEEYSQNIWEEKEWMLRDILNLWNTKRGKQDWSNIIYKYRSPIVVDGEILPTTPSVVNRFVCVPMYKEDKKGTPELLASFKWAWYLKDFVQTLLNVDKEDVAKKYFEYLKAVNKLWITEERTASNYAFILATNWIFNLFNEDALLHCISENAGLQDVEDGKEDPLASRLADIIVNKIVTPLVKVEWDDTIMCIPMTKEFVTKYTTIISSIIKMYWRERVHIENSNLQLHHNHLDSSDINNNFLDVISAFRRYCKDSRYWDFF